MGLSYQEILRVWRERPDSRFRARVALHHMVPLRGDITGGAGGLTLLAALAAQTARLRSV